MSDTITEKGNGSKKLIVIIVAAVLALAVILGVVLALTMGGNDQAPTDPPATQAPTNPKPTNPPEPVGVWHCVCGSSTDEHLPGCNGLEVQWTEWTSTNTLPITGGYYYLTADVTMETSEDVANVTTSESIYIDLNGKNINSKTRVYRIATGSTDVSLTFLDSVGTSVVTLTEHKNGASLVLVDSSGTKIVTFYGGTYDGSALNSWGADGATSFNGAMLRIGGGDLNIHGGTFIGASGVATGGVFYIQNGTATMTGGEIKDGHANNGGNVMLRTSTFNMTGGKISGGVAAGALLNGANNSRGGNIFSDRAAINISGEAEVSDGSAEYLGANIFTNQPETFTNTGKVTMSNSSSAGIYPIPDNAEDTNHMVCDCGSKTAQHLPGCSGTKYAWRPWTDATTLPSTSGRYYLAVDVVVSKETKITANASIYIDLNGHKITTSSRGYLANAKNAEFSLTILDSAGNGKWIADSNLNSNGAICTIDIEGKKSVTIYGGTFDGSAAKIEKNGVLISAHNADSTINIHGGHFIGGTTKFGGVAAVDYGTINITGGILEKGTGMSGGNLLIRYGATLNMTGGEIRLGKAVEDTASSKGRGGNIFNLNSTIKISGSAKVYDGTCVSYGENIFSSGDYTTDIKEGCVYLTSGGTGIYPVPVGEPDPNHLSCICGSKTNVHLAGCDGTKHKWIQWISTTTLPNESGYYYLSADVVLGSTVEITTDQNIYLDLNGCDITSTTRIYKFATAKTNVNLTVLDSVGGATVTVSDYTEGAAVFQMGNTGNKSVTIYGGKYDVSDINTVENGVFARVGSATSTLNVHGGHIIGGTAKFGGAVHIQNGTMNMTGGIIEGGFGDSAGNINIAQGSFIMTGGEVRNGTATATNGRGGNIFNNSGILNISGDAKVYDGTCVTLGANIFSITSAGNPEFDTEFETDCLYFTSKDGIGVYPMPIMEEDPNHNNCICGVDSDDPADHLEGCDGTKYNWRPWLDTESLPTKSGRYYLVYDVNLKTYNDIANGNNVYLDLNGKNINLNAGERIYRMIGNGASSLTVLDSVGGSMIKLHAGAAQGAFVTTANGTNVVTMYGGTVDGSLVNESSADGAVLRITGANAVFNMHGGTIIGGTATDKFGGAVYTNGTMNMTGGTIQGGTAKFGGSVFIAGKLTMTGGTIKDGNANEGENIYFGSNADVPTIGAGATIGFTDTTKTETGVFPTNYTVNHYLQNIGNDQFTLGKTETLKGTSGHDTAAIASGDYDGNGFTVQTFVQKTVKSDGTTVIDVYYTRNSYTVNWMVDGSSYANGILKFGQAIEKPVDPSKTGYTFKGWDPEIPATMPAQDQTFTAQFQYNVSYTVSFNTNGAGAIADQTIDENGKVTKPTDPTKQYFVFGGWYSDEGLTSAWNFDTDTVTADVTLYAKWTSVNWIELDGDDKLPPTTGYYKLVGDMTVSELTLLRGDLDIHIDLNGYKISGGVTGVSGKESKTECFYLIDNATTCQIATDKAKGISKLTILNSRPAAGGEIQMTKGCFVYLLCDKADTDNVGSELVINGGTIRGCDNATQVGGVIRIYGYDAHLVLNEGTIYGVKASTQNAGAVLVDGASTFTMTGGTIRDGYALNGGNVLVQGGAFFDMSGGEIMNGHATHATNGRGGNIFVSNSNSGAAIYGTAKVHDGNATSTSVAGCHNIIVLSGSKGLYMDAACTISYKTAIEVQITEHVYMTDTTTGDKILTPYINNASAN